MLRQGARWPATRPLHNHWAPATSHCLHPTLNPHQTSQCRHRSTATAAQPASLVEWVTSNGGQANGVTITKSAYGYGLVASADAQQGQQLIQLPRQCQLTYDTNVTDKRLLALIDKVPKDLWGPKLALQLLHYRLQGADSRFATYISQLPIGFNVPIFFGKEQLEAIQYIPVREQVIKRCRWMYEFSKSDLASLPGTDSDPYEGRLVDLNALGWAVAAVMSRAFRVCGPDRPAAMLPLIDMCNHSFDPNCEVVPITGLKGTLAMIAKRKISAGEPLMISYGNLSNDTLFMDYGFTIPDNPNDQIQLRFDLDMIEFAAQLGQASKDPLDLQSSLTPWKKRILKQAGFEGADSNAKITLGGTEVVEGRLLAAVRVLVAESESELRGRALGQLSELTKPLNKQNETTTLRILTGMALLSLSTFSTTLETDTALLEGRPPATEAGGPPLPALPLSPEMRLAVSYRLEKKRSIGRLMKTLAERMKAVESDPSVPQSAQAARETGTAVPTGKGFGGKGFGAAR